MMRIALFLMTNLAVMLVFGLILSLTGIQSSSVQGLMIMAGLFGFGGAFVSLLMSKWMALRSVGGEVIEQPRNETERWLVDTIGRQAQQAGIAMPQVAIYHAPDINAFATGARRDAAAAHRTLQSQAQAMQSGRPRGDFLCAVGVACTHA